MAEDLQKRRVKKSLTKSQRRATTLLWVSSCMMGLLIFALPTVFLFFFGMLPTFVAFIVDRNKDRYATFCVASMNFCGIFPFLMELWVSGHTITAAINIMTDVFALVIIYGAAACGWIIYSSIPPVVASILSVIEQRRVSVLKGQQQKLITEWGEGVAPQVDHPTVELQSTTPLNEENRSSAPLRVGITDTNENFSPIPPTDQDEPSTQTATG